MLKFLIVIFLSWLAAAIVYAGFVLRGMPLLAALIISYPLVILVTAAFHLRYCRTQREFLIAVHPWRDFFLISAVEFAVCAGVAAWLTARLPDAGSGEVFLISLTAAAVARYALRKELLLDIRGLRRETRADELR